MVKYKVNFLQAGLNDLEEIILYIAGDSPDSALSWHDKLISQVNNLAMFPMIGIPVPDKNIAKLGFRMLPIGNYLVFYKVYEQEKEITILRVLNGMRDYPKLFENYIPKNNE